MTVQVNCLFSQCDVSIQGFFSIYRWKDIPHLGGPIGSVTLKLTFQLNIFMGIHQIIHFDVYLCQ